VGDSRDCSASGGSSWRENNVRFRASPHTGHGGNAINGHLGVLGGGTGIK